MQTIDRYVLRIFIKVLVVCFVSMTGLFIVVDAFGNLEEFISYGDQRSGGLAMVLVDYYGARVLTFYDRISSVLALVAAVFVVTWLQRNNELTAIMAAGIHKGRLVKPLALAVFVVSLLAVGNRELLMPMARSKLVRNAQDWMGTGQKPLRPQFDHKLDILIGGRHTVLAERKIVEPNLRLFNQLGQFDRQIVAAHAVYRPAQADRPSGYLLHQVSIPENLHEFQSVHLKGEPAIFCPSDTAWLEDGQCFVVSEIDFDNLANGPSWRQYASSGELLRSLRSRSLDYGDDVRVAFHARLVQPLLDMALLFLGMSVVLSRDNRNMFVAGGLCFLVVVGFMITVLTCHVLGNNGILSPALAAWSPLLVFVPLAFAMSGPLRR